MDNNYQNEKVVSKKDKVFSVFGKVGLIIGYCSIPLCIIPFVGFALAAIGIVFSVFGIFSSNLNESKKGLILNIIFTVVGFIYIIVVMVLIVLNSEAIINLLEQYGINFM